MTDWPNISRFPDPDTYEESVAKDPTIRSETESGKVLTRARFTLIKKTWLFTITNLTPVDKGILVTFQNTVRVGASSFNWHDPYDSGTVYEVRLSKPFRFSPQPGDPKKWMCDVELEEA
jgi:hypothetical protein